ncbi:DUF6976 family protein [Agaribacterium haliotis]|uniref:DUF6976 family protein n=1 Tax=Agaribacterium haliotis TaxID=2013869 RepID=UPI000BB55077|nr:hypothetical protein [Agaribacterium haliotis]
MAGDGNIAFNNELLDRDAVIQKIERGDYLIIAGDESQLAGLPSGNWIAGTIPYFMSGEGGVVDQSKLYVNTLEGLGSRLPRITMYDTNSISRIAQEGIEGGFTIVILPASSEVHLKYAQEAPDFPNMFFSPIIGWISGVHLDQLESLKPKVGFGLASGMLSDSQAVAMHVPLPEGQEPHVRTVNLFTQGDGPALRFPTRGFNVNECQIDGQSWKFSDYLKENKIDTRLPLVANYCGMMVNVSIQEVLDGDVKLYAPVFPDIEYHFATPVDDYVNGFNEVLSHNTSHAASFSCNCILNFLYSELEGKKTGQFTGPMTFGEVAYQLMNQTMVYLTLDNS